MPSLHLRLTNEQWVRETKGLRGAEIKVLYYIKTLDPFGDRELDLNVTRVAIELGLSKGTVSKALKTLDAHELIDLELIQVRVRVTAKGINTDVSQSEQSFSQETEFPIGNDDVLEETPVSYGKRENPIGNNEGLKPLQSAGSGVSHTIQTNSNSFKQEKSALAEESFGKVKRPINSVKGTEKSVPSDPWMNGVNPKLEFKQWLCDKRKKEGFVGASLANAHSEICNDHTRAEELWKDFLLATKGIKVDEASISEEDYPRLLQEALNRGENEFHFVWKGNSKQEAARRNAWLDKIEAAAKEVV